MDLTQRLEAFLFWKGEPVSFNDLAKILETDTTEIENAVRNLTDQYQGRGIAVVSQNNEVAMVTAPGASELIEKVTREELSSEIGKAGLETLTIIAYKGPISRAEIDYIRGVNSSFIIRNLMIRGLIEKASQTKDARVFLYQPTMELTKHLGLGSIADLPEYQVLRENLTESLVAAKETHE